MAHATNKTAYKLILLYITWHSFRPVRCSLITCSSYGTRFFPDIEFHTIPYDKVSSSAKSSLQTSFLLFIFLTFFRSLSLNSLCIYYIFAWHTFNRVVWVLFFCLVHIVRCVNDSTSKSEYSIIWLYGFFSSTQTWLDIRVLAVLVLNLSNWQFI